MDQIAGQFMGELFSRAVAIAEAGNRPGIGYEIASMMRIAIARAAYVKFSAARSVIEDQRGEVVDIDGSFAKLVVCVDDDLVTFALFEWMTADADDTNRQFRMIFHGRGITGGLRECRHIWWGEGGYVYLMPLDVVAKAMAALRKWFDE